MHPRRWALRLPSLHHHHQGSKAAVSTGQPLTSVAPIETGVGVCLAASPAAASMAVGSAGGSWRSTPKRLARASGAAQPQALHSRPATGEQSCRRSCLCAYQQEAIQYSSRIQCSSPGMGMGEGVGATLLSVMLRMAPRVTPAACKQAEVRSRVMPQVRIDQPWLKAAARVLPMAPRTQPQQLPQPRQVPGVCPPLPGSRRLPCRCPQQQCAPCWSPSPEARETAPWTAGSPAAGGG